MLNNFCFHVYTQKSLFKVENVNAFFFDINAFSLTKLYGQHPFLFLSVSRAGSQLKIPIYVVNKIRYHNLRNHAGQPNQVALCSPQGIMTSWARFWSHMAMTLGDSWNCLGTRFLKSHPQRSNVDLWDNLFMFMKVTVYRWKWHARAGSQLKIQ